MTTTGFTTRTLDLAGNWSLRRQDEILSVPATVPGCVHTDLLAESLIADPFYRDNETAVQWVSDHAWVYSRGFEATRQFLAHDRVALHCEGLDTLATVSVNGRTVGRTDNMFRTWEFDAKPFLRPGANRIEIRFDPALPHTRALQAKRYLHSWSTRDGVNWLRKEQCNYGWDWGPRVITCGIWRGIGLRAWSKARIEDVLVTQKHHRGGRVDVKAEVALDRAHRSARRTTPEPLRLVARLAFGRDVIGEVQTECGNRESQAFAFHVNDPKLWYPRGLGAQPLYRLTVELLDDGGQLLDSWTRRIGLRTLQLDRQKDQWGESFQFTANGTPFFAKGANWIPADAFAARVTDQHCRHLLESAAEANMNFLRVWGGGTYESDLFYDLCDELGLCVWQDFMFACAAYPAFDKQFMANVRAEAEDNVRRLRHHPCIALWCGNNELEQGLVGPAWTEHQMSWTDYSKLFDRLLPSVTRVLDPQRDYWPGSPHTPGSKRADFNNPDRGDAHLWAVWHGHEPFEWYRGAFHRFCSEFGFQSFPEPRTIESFTLPGDRNISSHVMDFHQRSHIGNSAIVTYMLSWYRLPEGFADLAWMSQILHAMAMKYAVEHWRRQMPRCMGAIYWQLNDTWPGASWASIDYFGRWKALQFAARRFFAPVMVSLVEKPAEKSVEVWVSSDLRESVDGRLFVTVTDCAGEELRTASRDVRLTRNKSAMVMDMDLGAELDRKGERNLLVWAQLEAPGQPVSRNLATFARPKHLDLRRPGIDVNVEKCADGSFHVTLAAWAPALHVWLQLPGIDARFSDNFIDLPMRRPATITVWPKTQMTRQEFSDALQVRSLFDIGHYE